MPAKVYHIESANGDSAKKVAAKLSALMETSGILDKIEKDDFTAIKLHFGEKGNKGYLRHEWVAEAARHVARKTRNGFLTDSNVIYKASVRTNSVDHLKNAEEHGFSIESIGMPIVIADGIFGMNFTEIDIFKKHFSKVKIAADIAACDSLLALTHITGHMQAGLGGAIKNLGMGCASRRGKYEQHCGVVPAVDASVCTGCGSCVAHCPASCIALDNGKVKIFSEECLGCGECAVVCRTTALDIKWSETLENLQEKMVEYACGVLNAVKGRAAFISFLKNVTKDCDCMSKDQHRIVDDLGILASFDPVSIDKAAVDLMIANSGKDVLKNGYPGTDWMAQLRYAEKIGLGSLDYTLERL